MQGILYPQIERQKKIQKYAKNMHYSINLHNSKLKLKN
jgi:hypothetical protein